MKNLYIDDIKENRAVVVMTDCEWFITPWTLEETVDWFNEQYDYGLKYEEAELCDLDKEGFWWCTTDSQDIERLGECDEISSYIIKDGQRIRQVQFGDLQKSDNQVYKFTSIRNIILEHYSNKPMTEPELIASTEW